MKIQHHHLRSRAWYLLPIFLSLVGGLIAFFVLRHSDSDKARNCLIIGFAILGFSIVTSLILPMFGLPDSLF